MDLFEHFSYFKCCIILCAFGLIMIFYSIDFDTTFFGPNWPIYGNTNCTQNITNEFNFTNKIMENDWSKMCSANLTQEEMERLFPPDVDRYVFATWGGLCGGLGNQMWRFASLYGIAKPYGRTPIFKEDQQCLHDNGPHESEGVNELQQLFPVYASRLKFIKANEIENDTFYLKEFAPGCCTYEDPQRIFFSRIKQKYVKIDGYYFQSYKFFENRKTEIRQIFQFGPSICAKVEAYKNELFQEDNSHKLCVHERIEDFKKLGVATNKEFAETGIRFVHQRLKEKFGNVSVVLLGAEKPFLVSLDIDKKMIPNVYLPKVMSRGEDMAFGATVCDSLLITAPSSTFSWWIAYLMRDGAHIFYDAKLEGTAYTRVNFLPEWTPLKMVNGTIVLD